MIRIAIVDDADLICETIETFLKRFSRENKLSIEFDSYYSGTEIINQLSDKYYDCIFLDIEIGERNGIDVSRYLRDTLKNETTEIIYISSHTQYAVELFDFDPVTFLVKPIEEEKLIKGFAKFLRRLKLSEEVFAFKNGREIYRIPLKDIMYFQSSDHRIILHALKEKYTFYDKIDRLAALLEPKKFLFVHKSFLVNSRHIQNFGYETVTINNGDVISVSQSRRKAIREWQLENETEEAGWHF
ncbi:MAG: LytTR family DNA-binding domain-containing protein [Oscillospiraceae bacterium]|nr:LytTR family DNA-binding domain-containing protein [Oscillospiraceae bacterium]